MDESLLEDSVFSDAGDSSDFAIAKPKAKPAAKKAGAPKKPAAASKTKAAAPKKRAKPDSDAENSDHEQDSMDIGSYLSNTPPEKKVKTAPVKKSSGKVLGEIANESFSMADDGTVALGKAPKGASDKYKKITHLDHILIRPDTYIGSVEKSKQEMWVYNSETDAIEYREVTYVPGLYKIFDEILVNAADNKQNDKTMSEIKVVVDREKGEISVQNDGKGIPIEMHKSENMYIPELIFGHLLTSSNYDDNQAKVTGGRNGYGAKLCNVFSTEFSIETVDSKQKKKYRQTWTNNMSKKGKAKITDFSGKDYTKVTFKPDYAKFGMQGMDDDFEALVKRRIYDMAGTCAGVKVSLNGKRIAVKDFKTYMAMYTKSLQGEAPEGEGEGKKDKDVIIVDTPNERWTIGFAVSDGSFKQVSFVNSIATTFGGTHVNFVAKQVVEKLTEHMKKENKKGVALKPHQIQNHMFLFVNCKIINPAFTSQTKEQLTTKSTAFGSKCTLSDKFLRDILKTDVVKNIMHFAAQKADQLLAKSDGSKRARMNNAKLVDANRAGTKDGYKCTLILTEGDSASGLALAGRAVLDPDHIGVFPLRGKMLNVRDASIAQISNNAEIQNIKKFMGLQHKKEYTDTKGLRYGHLMIMTDQDHDGSHIKGLLINFFESQFPSLLKLPTFLKVFITPIVKCWKGDIKQPSKKVVFYTMPEYEAWRKQPGNATWDHKYYKGLGTSSTEEAEGYFRDLDRHLKEFEAIQPNEPELIDLAFSKKKADARKAWLRDFIPGTFMDMAPRTISYNDFINKELILFSMADNLRSIPSLVDGLKPSQRKVMYTCFETNLKKDRKVVELAGIVSGRTAYPYGDASLQQTIVALAQTFVGSNNVNLLEPSGNFGSRRLGGQDAASARYIYTRLSPFARHLYNAADEALLQYNEDDGKTIEPVHYVPILPVLLLNGADGIGTGWSTQIPNYKPEDIVDNLKRRMQGSKEDMMPMEPWFRGFKGPVVDLGQNRWQFNGIANQTDDNEIEITELPVRYWTQDFKDKLEDIIKAEKTPSFIKDYAEYNTPTNVHFVIKLDDKHMKISLDKGLEEAFKLSKTITTSNLVAFDAEGRIHKYETVLDIMEEFYIVRLKMYERRKQHMLEQLQSDLDKFNNQARFISMIINNKLVISKKKKAVLVQELRELNFKPFAKKIDAKKAGENEAVVDDAEGSEDQTGATTDYDYLLGMAIWSLTEERIAKLKKQIGDKELDIDSLIKLSPKDLWITDLDNFITEWHQQLEDERVRAKNARRAGRRASAKLGLAGGRNAGGKRKRKGDDSDDDDDFTVGKKKKPAVKNVLNRVKENKPSALLEYFSKPSESASAVVKKDDNEDFMDLDKVEAAADLDAMPGLVAVKKRSKPAAPKAKIPLVKASITKDKADLSDVDDVFAAVAAQAKSEGVGPTAGRQRRAAPKAKYVDSDTDMDSSERDDMLGDVSMMVKGIGNVNGDNAGSNSRSLFANTVARPSSSHSLPKSIQKPKADPLDSDGIDETDYKSLIPTNSPVRPAARHAITAGDEDTMDDSFDMPPPKPRIISKKPNAAVSKPLAKTKAAPAAKPAAKPMIVKKPMERSPAAKAYALKQAAKGLGSSVNGTSKAKSAAAPKKGKKAAAAESDEELADEILDDDDDEDKDESIVPAPRAKSGRAAAATAKAKASKYVFDDDSDEDEELQEDEEESFMVDDSD